MKDEDNPTLEWILEMTKPQKYIPLNQLSSRSISAEAEAKRDAAELQAARQRIREHKANFFDLVLIEPRLAAVAAAAVRYAEESKQRSSACANRRWGGAAPWEGQGLKQWMRTLVGWESRDKDLHSEYAYDLARVYIYEDLLPDCRNCSCMDFAEFWP
ncbi:MAG: hypothetical protein EKK71_16340 [Candidatus Competibacteraceae bacterium]|nr:MAG: hypothetical protein EKK71_16340 [Candidatus Competibacteraceae bacterium]